MTRLFTCSDTLELQNADPAGTDAHRTLLSSSVCPWCVGAAEHPVQGRGTGIFSNAPQTGFATTCLQFGFREDFFFPRFLLSWGFWYHFGFSNTLVLLPLLGWLEEGSVNKTPFSVQALQNGQEFPGSSLRISVWTLLCNSTA